MSAGLAPSLAASLDRLGHRLRELDEALADPVIAADNRRFRDLSREHAEVSGVCSLAQRHAQRQHDLATAQELLRDAGSDPDLRAMASEEVADAEAELSRLYESLAARDLAAGAPSTRRLFS